MPGVALMQRCMVTIARSAQALSLARAALAVASAIG
jgi:hypothetical protein